MQEQQKNSDNMIANTSSLNNLTEIFQPLESSTTVETTTSSSAMSGICYINNNNNFNNIKKTSPLSMPSGIIKLQTIQQNDLKFYTENVNDNNHHQQDLEELNKSTSENTKDILLNTTNYSQNTIINNNNNNINNNSNSHYKIINSNIFKLNSTSTTTTRENCYDKKSALNCKTNSDNNLLLLNNDNNYNLTNIQQSNGYNNTKLNIIKSIEKLTTTSQIVAPSQPLLLSTVNKNLDTLSSSSSTVDHENACNQRSYVEDVHNYSKKSNGYDLSSSGSNNTSSGTDEYESDYNYNDDYDEEFINLNKNKRNFNKKFTFDTETDNNNKWLKVGKTHNQTKILNRHNNDDNKLKDKSILNMKSKTPDSGVPDDDDKLTPDHHARRPMNAFLIFCKRHRAIVRDKYKNVENRQITKILGEWWANMTDDEKSSYANLAKENKDQFLSANPNFKWYKLPAPPLRTLTTRPLNNNTTDSLLLKKDEDKNQLDSNEHITSRNHNNSTLTNQQHPKKLTSPISTKAQVSNVGVFKFADETQMGSLNNLICGGGDGNTDNASPTHSIKSSSLSPKDDQNQSDELQHALSETSDFLNNTITNTNFETILHEPFENMRDHAKKMKNDKLNFGTKRKLPATMINIDNGGKKLLRDNSFSSSEDDTNILNRKLSRTCKGKKYQELINSGQISVLSKKPKKNQDFLPNYDHSYSNGNPNNNYSKDSSSDSDYYNNISPNLPNEYRKNCTGTNNINNDHNKKLHSPKSEKFQSIDNIITKKQYDMIVFDLDSKIMALPAQCLENYLLKKQESKSKKKINSKRRKTTTGNNTKKQLNNNTNGNNGGNVKQQPESKTIQEIKEQIVGSQKRKARKESITRRDISGVQNEAKLINYVEFGGGTASNTDGVIQIKEEIPDSLEIDVSEEIINEPNFGATDLLILAEVASNVDE